ncbi:hypothetical protein [Nonomuraea sp. NPDC005501]|uniref:hypothetical protein n=1 Tax=Nonomuraea sp. NPDC005501 TaxID=3156884 RepID=UPI0033BF23C5
MAVARVRARPRAESALERVSRLARAAVFAAVCVVVSAGGHSLAGGAPVAAPTLFLGVVAAFVLAFVLSGRERGPEVVIGVTAGAQTLLHELFSRSAPVAVVHADHVHGESPGAGMTVAHLVGRATAPTSRWPQPTSS